MAKPSKTRTTPRRATAKVLFVRVKQTTLDWLDRTAAAAATTRKSPVNRSNLVRELIDNAMEAEAQNAPDALAKLSAVSRKPKAKNGKSRAQAAA